MVSYPSPSNFNRARFRAIFAVRLWISARLAIQLEGAEGADAAAQSPSAPAA